jgi:NADH:ubiquinone oxidoreductase subunit 2 (subunit N)
MSNGIRNDEEIKLTWRPLVLGPTAVVLFFLALWFNDGGTALLGIILLDVSFCVAMLWVVLAARATDNLNSPLRAFVPKLTAFLVLGAAFLAATRWRTDKRISAMELGFVALYVIAGYITTRIFEAKSKPLQLKPVTDRKRARRKS